MADKKRYIAQYRMPVGFDNPPLNLPTANKPEVVRLTDEEAEQAKKMLPDLKLVRAKDQELSPEAQIAAAKDEASEEEAEGSEAEASGEEQEPDNTEAEQESEAGEGSEEEEEQEAEAPAETHSLDADEDFPGLEQLKEAGMETVEDVVAFKADNDLSDIDGIGNARKGKIVAYLEENYSDLLNE